MSQLVIKSLHVQLGDQALLSGIDLTLEPGSLVALVGPNGAGKSTLIRAALGLVRPTQGAVQLGGRDVRSIPPRERAGMVAWLPQLLVTAESYPVVELVAAARYRFRESHACSVRAARASLARVEADHLAARLVTDLSGGERQRVAIASLLAQDAPLLLLDEPANHLDPAQQMEVYGLIGKLWQTGAGVLCVTHDVNLLASLNGSAAVRVVGLCAGRLRFELAFDAPELPAALSELFGTPMQVLENGQRRAIVPWPASRKPTSCAPDG